MRSFPISYSWIRRLSLPILIGGILQGAAVCIAQGDINSTLASDSAQSPTESTKIEILNQADYSYTNGNVTWLKKSNAIDFRSLLSLVDPKGQILGCGGEPLDDYTGFRVALYEPDPSDPTGTELGALLRLTSTEFPNLPDNNIPEGITPNTLNQNPFLLSNSNEGEYSFLLNRQAGQLDIGRTYILVVDPPENVNFTQRRIRLEIINISPLGNSEREQVQYRATSLDGQPIGIQGQTAVTQSVVVINDADRVGLQFLALQFMSTVCQRDQIEISKSGDRANAAPGDVVVYRLSVRNISDVPLDTLSIDDVLPAGFKFLDHTVGASLNGEPVDVSATQSGQSITFQTPTALPVDEAMTFVYAAQLTPDALRGDGQNSASVRAQRVDNDLEIQDGPAIHKVRITPGLLSDCGTILGRVFVDHNFDGKQQPGEPGVPNAVVYMDDGNRITTDEDGMFNVKCVLPGYRTGALDLTTIPGYSLAPNLKFIERNSPSRLVHLAPGSLVQMSFGVTPAVEEEKK